MSMSAYIRVIPDAGKRDVAIQTIKNLEKLNLEIPSELYDLKDGDVDIPQVEYNTDYEEIIEIKVKDIPKEAEKIQFVISY
jgi:hypothetical protein